MLGNVACSFLNCSNPVTGQCIGYKGDCRKYYCATHSTDNLCYSCASKKWAEENEALTKQRYLKMISGMKSQAGLIGWKLFWGQKETVWGIAVTLVFLLLGLILGKDNDIGIFFLVLGWVGIALEFFTLVSEIGKQEKILAKNIDGQERGFLNFFTAWKKERQIKTWSTIGSAIVAVVGFIFLIFLAALASGAKDSSEDARIKRAVDDELNRRS